MSAAEGREGGRWENGGREDEWGRDLSGASYGNMVGEKKGLGGVTENSCGEVFFFGFERLQNYC